MSPTPTVPVSLPAALDEWERLARVAMDAEAVATKHARLPNELYSLAEGMRREMEVEKARTALVKFSTPGRILGLIAAVRADSAESTRQFMRAERNYTGWNRTAEVARGLEAVIDDALTAMREPMTLADARRARDLLTHAAVERSKANAAAREARAAAPEERDDATAQHEG